jgi:hypothetical protein
MTTTTALPTVFAAERTTGMMMPMVAMRRMCA